MEILKFNIDTKKFDLFDEVDLEVERVDNKTLDKYLIVSGDLVELVDNRIEYWVSDIILHSHMKMPFKKQFGLFTYVSYLARSKSRKSVHQYYPHNGHHSSEKFNLPEEFRDKTFQAILALKKGPFTKQKISNQLVEANPWYCNEVFFAGRIIECLEMIINIKINDLLLNNYIEILTAAQYLEDKLIISNQFSELLKDEAVKSRLNHVISYLNESFLDMDEDDYFIY